MGVHEVAFRRAPSVVHEMIGARAVLLNSAGTELITLNPVGTSVWLALDGTTDARDVASTLLDQYPDVGVEELTRDVERFLAELEEAELVVRDAGG